MNRSIDAALLLASDLAARWGLSALAPLLAACRAAAAQDEISVAVVGRFKAGKSSFLNHFFGRDLLPVGVTPVTAVITEIRYGPAEKATVQFLNGRSEEIAIDAIRQFVAEKENPDNEKQVRLLETELPQLDKFRGLRFVDTPGLDSVFTHNTEESLNWLPNAGLALAAISVDPPLSQQDIALLKNLYRYTPKISILLTKADLLNDAERAEVIAFVGAQLARVFGSAPQILPYSIRPGYKSFKMQLEERSIRGILAEFQEQRDSIIGRKLETLLGECAGYLTLALKSAEMIGAERESLKQHVSSEKQIVDEVKSELRLVVRHAAAGTRTAIENLLKPYQSELETRLLGRLKGEFPHWTKSLAYALESYAAWLTQSLTNETISLSARERARIIAPVEKVRKQIWRRLQSFRDELSERTERAFGVPLRTAETELHVKEPHQPDVRVGRVFDRNWEIFSFVIPMALVKPIVRRHFIGALSFMVEKNLSRLTSQWADSVTAALAAIGEEAESRLDELIATVERLVTSSDDDAPQIRADLARIDSAQEAVRGIDGDYASRPL